jgi:predicted aspartyl protease
MFRLPRQLPVLFALSSLAFCSGDGYSRQNVSIPPRRSGLVQHDQLLKATGYLAIPMQRYAFLDWMRVEATIGDARIDLLIDTGAHITTLDTEKAKRFNLNWTPTQETHSNLMNVDSPSSTHPCNGITFGCLKTGPFTLRSFDLAEVKGSLARNDKAHFDGILGADLLKTHGAIIDYGSMTLYLRDLTPVK